MNEYEKQANDWAGKWGVTMTASKLGHFTHWEEDTDTRDVYEITLSRDTGGGVSLQMRLKFGQNLVNSRYDQTYSAGPYWRDVERKANGWPKHPGKAPTLYDVIACIQKYDVGTFEDFCGEFGYDTDSRRALSTFLAVQAEAADFARLCGPNADMREEAQEIS